MDFADNYRDHAGFIWRTSMSKKINVLLVDDHAVVRAGYKAYLSLCDKIGLIHEADRGESACQSYDRQRPDVVVLDISMPGIGGLETIRRLIQRDPHCKILVFSIHDEPIYASRALKAGAKGYIIKSSVPDTLVTAVCTIAQGGTFIAPELAQRVALSMVNEQDEANILKQLSPREFDIFCLLANGLTPREIADKLRLSYKTICNHSTAIKDKLELKTMAELTLLASRHGLIQSPYAEAAEHLEPA
jgi:two-component system invasion response regulator UvrY